VWGLNKKCPSGFAQPIGRIPGEQDLPWDAVSITQIQRTGLENPDFGSVFVRGWVARPFTRRVLLTPWKQHIHRRRNQQVPGHQSGGARVWTQLPGARWRRNLRGEFGSGWRS